ncbi:MAG: hypothetical protein J7K75_13285 [Desulfuromonas sp.]|nr:hypothetical protein [Desulfuromonas sp.]
MMTFQINKKLPERSHEQPDSPQLSHIGKNMNRVQPLPGHVEIKEVFQRIADIFKDRLIQAQPSDRIAHGPEGARRDISTELGRIGNVQRILSHDVESKFLKCLLISQTLHLLQQYRAEHGVKLLGASPDSLLEKDVGR